MFKAKTKIISRRKAVTGLAGAAAAAYFIPAWNETIEAATATCSLTTPDVTEGPYWVDEKLFRSDIRTDPSTGLVQAGIPLALTITVINSNASCAALTGAYLDVWHCGATGIYSDESTYNPGGGTGNVTTTGEKFLRGYQITDANGQVSFTTIYPGWYNGRTIHIHVRIRTYSGAATLTNYTTQIFFDDTINNTVLTNAAYARTSARDTTNATDMVYTTAGSNNASMLATVTQTSTGYAATLTIDMAALTVTSTVPAIASNGILSAASGVAGVAPGSWISIYGTNLSPTTDVVASSDLVSNYLPTTFQNVSVLIDGEPAYLDYISPTQINLLAPADSNTGSVQVTVTNANGTSSAATVTLQAILPGLFVLSNYVRAVRASDGAIINGTGNAESGYTTVATATAGDVIELYGTGFGPTTPSVAAGLVFTGAYPTSNPVTVSVGGIPAVVSFAGLSGPGLCQINLTVPAGLTAGDNAIIAKVGGYSTQSTALLKIAS
jgi:uncharacterized protein (TIGR03437 family)